MARLQLSEPLNNISYNNEQAISMGSVAMVRLQLSDQLTDTSYSNSYEQAPSMGYERGVSQSASDGFSYYARPPSLTDVAGRDKSYSVGPGPMEVDNNSASMSEIPEVHTRKRPEPTMKGQRGLYKIGFCRKAEMKVIRAGSITDDGYAWRKYGQKEILGSKFPRFYFRCAQKYTTGCQALKQVQRLEPSKFDITYIGHHTCPNTSHLGA